MRSVLAALLLHVLSAAARVEVVYVHKRAVTYAATCTFYNTITLQGAVPTTNLVSSSCTSPAVSGPYVTQNCFADLIQNVCNAPTTASACASSTSTRTLTNFLGFSTGTSLVPTSTCSNAVFPPGSTPAPGTNCFADNVGGVRTLSGASTSSNTMTNAFCKTYCNNLGFAYSGTEYSAECFCGNTLPTTSSTSCTMLCSNAGSNEICGGPNALSVSTNTAMVTTNNANAATVSQWTNQGCYVDNYPVRVLSGGSTTSTTLMTVAYCVNYCNNLGFTLAGVEYGSECYCGNTVATDGSTYGTPGASGCTYACSGKAGEICGGSNRLNLYSKATTVASSVVVTTTSASPVASPAGPFTPVPQTANGYNYVNCYLDGATARTLTVNKGTVSSVGACVTACSSSGYKFAGVEFRGECWCDNEIRSTVIDASNCNMKCDGTATQNCGGANAIQIYQGTPGTTVAVPQTVGSFTYVQSYKDSVDNRVLAEQHALSSVTVNNCVSTCANLGFTYAGLEFGSQCWCGSALRNNPVGGQTPTTPCTGNSGQFCGGSNILQVYQGTPAPQYLTTPFTNGACVADNINNTRTLAVGTSPSSSMTPTLCRSQCSSYTYYGVEYGSECWCDNTFPAATTYSSSCTMKCSGDNTLSCGGSYALNIYKTNP